MQRAFQFRLAIFLGFSVACAPLVGTRASQESITSESPARAEIEELIRESGATVSLAFRALDGTQELFLNADARYDDPNALRLPVMIAVYRAAYAHAISLDDPVRARGSAGGPNPATIGELCESMIVENNDPATNLLLERFTLAGVRDQIRSLGAEGMEIGATFPNSEKNHTTSRALLILLWKLANERVVSAEASKEMLALLSRSPLHSVPPVSPVVFPVKPAPAAGAPVAVRDAVTIFGARSYVLVIQVQGLQDTPLSAELIAKITSALTKMM